MRWLSALSLVLFAAATLLAENVKGTQASPLDFANLRKVERSIDGRIERFDTESPMYVIGATRGVYVEGTGLVFSVEVSLAPAVGITPFFTKLKPEEIEKIYNAKRARVPVIRDLLLSSLPELAESLPALPAGEDVMVAVTMFYFPYEKLDGMPRQMVVRGDVAELRKLLVAGQQVPSAKVAAIGKVFVY